MTRKLDRSILEGDSIVLFRAAIRSRHTLDPYERKLITFLVAIKMTADDFVKLAKSEPAKAERMVMQYIIDERVRVENKQITAGTLSNTVKAVRLLLEMNDVIFNWRKLRRLIPPVKRFANDRIPSREELLKMLDATDLRGRALTLIFISSGIREGAVESLKAGDVSATEVDGKLVAGRLVAYSGDADQYVTFISPEAYNAMLSYLDYRRQNGENITKSSPLIRDLFDAKNNVYARHNKPDVNDARTLDGHAIRMLYNRLFYALGFRAGPRKRHEFSVHSFRKWFKTKAESAGMKPIEVETLMNHSTGITDSYWRPTENDMLQAYVKVVPSLSISKAAELEIKLEQEKTLNSEKIASLEHRLNSLVASALGAKAEVPKQ